VGLLEDKFCHMIHLECLRSDCSAEVEGTRISELRGEGLHI
jgi:hypothetical protein